MWAGLMELMAALASSTNGWAFVRSLEQLSFSEAIRSASASHLALMPATCSPSALASAELTSSPSSILFVLSVASSSLTCSAARTTFMASTSAAPWMSLSSPSLTLPSFSLSASSFSRYMAL